MADWRNENTEWAITRGTQRRDNDTDEPVTPEGGGWCFVASWTASGMLGSRVEFLWARQRRRAK